jgi:hypothetical protein
MKNLDQKFHIAISSTQVHINRDANCSQLMFNKKMFEIKLDNSGSSL